MNIVTNVRDAMPGGGRVTVSTSIRLPTADTAPAQAGVPCGRYVGLSFADTGIGIPGDSLPYIFKPLFTTKSAGGASGVGLATVADVVARHGGWIEVESTGPSGTTFVVWLPAASPVAPVGTSA